MNGECRQFESMPPDINESDWRVHGADPGLLQGFSRALAVFILDLKSGKNVFSVFSRCVVRPIPVLTFCEGRFCRFAIGVPMVVDRIR